MTDTPRLIEFAFPLKQASLDSVHEKNVRHGHISTLHIWPARRPLAACRAALIATLLPDPGTPEGRRKLCEKIGGKVVKRIEKKKMPGGQVVEREKEETVGGILHWGREAENAETLEWFRQEIRKAYGGRAPKVLDPFAGGGAIPLEAMRLGCEATAVDINPVAWFILKCTLEYPQKLSGQKRPLPKFVLQNREFMEAFFKAQGFKGKTLKQQLEAIGFADNGGRSLKGLGFEPPQIEADLAWHVRAWGQWVLERARRDLAQYYPVYADFEPLQKDQKSYEQQRMQLVPLKDDGTPDIDALNREFSAKYLAIKKNPRWVAKPTVAYLWARTVTCKNCRATMPLLKTRWLCKKDRKRVLLTMEPNADKSGVVFGVETNVPVKGGNAAQRREHDKRIGTGTMSGAGAKCPCCSTIMTMEDIRLSNRAHEVGTAMTAVVIQGKDKEYRLPTPLEISQAKQIEHELTAQFEGIPYGPIYEEIHRDGQGASYGFPIVAHGITQWNRLFSPRQMGTFACLIRSIHAARDYLKEDKAPSDWTEATIAALCCVMSRLADFQSTFVTWTPGGEFLGHTFVRYALPLVWDFAEGNPLVEVSGSFPSGLDWVARVLAHTLEATSHGSANVTNRSVLKFDSQEKFDAIVTDPPYYDAIGYSDLMDFFYIWLRRSVAALSPELHATFSQPNAPKWDREHSDGEIIDDMTRFDGDASASKKAYEDGMSSAFRRCNENLRDNGRLVIVFASKSPDAWETLVAAVIRAGFIVDGAWPIQTERQARTRSLSSAALASSVWLVCKKRSLSARPGWDNKVLEEMRANIGQRLRDFWDAGIRGPDFVWAATGPALEAYSKHPVVKMANDPGQTLSVTEFLNHARRMVVDFVVGRVLTKDEDNGGMAAADRLDEPTAYYLLHRNDFNLDEAPVGACILYATACGLSDQELVRDWDLLAKTGSDDAAAADEEETDSDSDDEPSEETSSGSKVKLKGWNQRRGRSLGYEAPGGRPVPLIDRIHRLMHLWKGGDVHKVDEYLDEHGLRRHELFRRVLQSLIELAKAGSEERSLLESLSNHIGAKGAKRKDPQRALAYGDEESEAE